MSKSSKITASELVLSAIFFLQQKNGVTAKDITKFICEKRGCRQSQVRREVKRALERATENGIFSKKRGLYRIESGFGRNKISIKVKGSNKAKKMKKVKHSNSARATDASSYTGVLNMPEYSPAVEVPTFSRKATYSMHPYTDAHAMMLNDGLENSVKKISVEPMTCAKNVYVDDDDDDDEDDEEDFFEEDDDEDDIDYFADDQFPSASDAVKEYPPSEHDSYQEEKKKDSSKRKAKSRSKSRTKGKAKRRKLSKPKKKTCKRKRNIVMRKNQKKTREPDSDEEMKQKNNDYENDDEENIEQGSEGDYAREDDEDGQNENDVPGGSEDDNKEHNHEDYEYDDYPSDEEYLIQQQDKKTKGKERSENKKGVAKLPGEGDQKQEPQGTTDVKVNQSGKAENKQNDSAPTAPATAPQQEVSKEDKKSKPIRSSSLFSSFKKKNESKASCADRKQIKSRM